MKTIDLPFFFFSSRRRHTRCSRDWSSDVCSSDLLDALGRDAKRNGIEIRLPDVNVSDVWCTVEGALAAVRVGLGFIRDWSEETATAGGAERGQGGPVRSVGDGGRSATPEAQRPAAEDPVRV